MTTLRRNVLTAKARPKDLKEHEEGFIAANGIKEQPPVDPNSEVSGVVGQLNAVEFISCAELTQKARDIIKLTGKVVRHSSALNMLARALGYASDADLRQHLKGPVDAPYVQNLNYGRNDLAAVVQEVNERTSENVQAIIDILVPEIELIYSLPDEREWLSQRPRAATRPEYVQLLQDFQQRHQEHYTDLTHHRRTAFDVAFSLCYPTAATKSIREERYYLPGQKSSLVKAARKILQRRYAKTTFSSQD